MGDEEGGVPDVVGEQIPFNPSSEPTSQVGTLFGGVVVGGVEIGGVVVGAALPPVGEQIPLNPKTEPTEHGILPGVVVVDEMDVGRLPPSVGVVVGGVLVPEGVQNPSNPNKEPTSQIGSVVDDVVPGGGAGTVVVVVSGGAVLLFDEVESGSLVVLGADEGSGTHTVPTRSNPIKQLVGDELSGGGGSAVLFDEVVSGALVIDDVDDVVDEGIGTHNEFSRTNPSGQTTGVDVDADAEEELGSEGGADDIEVGSFEVDEVLLVLAGTFVGTSESEDLEEGVVSGSLLLVVLGSTGGMTVGRSGIVMVVGTLDVVFTPACLFLICFGKAANCGCSAAAKANNEATPVAIVNNRTMVELDDGY